MSVPFVPDTFNSSDSQLSALLTTPRRSPLSITAYAKPTPSSSVAALNYHAGKLTTYLRMNASIPTTVASFSSAGLWATQIVKL